MLSHVIMFDFSDTLIFLFFSAEKLPVRVLQYSNTQHRVFKSNFVFNLLITFFFFWYRYNFTFVKYLLQTLWNPSVEQSMHFFSGNVRFYYDDDAAGKIVVHIRKCSGLSWAFYGKIISLIIMQCEIIAIIIYM